MCLRSIHKPKLETRFKNLKKNNLQELLVYTDVVEARLFINCEHNIHLRVIYGYTNIRTNNFHFWPVEIQTNSCWVPDEIKDKQSLVIEPGFKKKGCIQVGSKVFT